MTKQYILFAENKISFLLIFFSIFFLVQYIRKKRRTLLMLAITSFVYVALSLTIFLGQKGNNLLCISFLGILAVVGSYKELVQLEKEGKNISHLFEFDVYDYILAGMLFILWSVLKYILG